MCIENQPKVKYVQRFQKQRIISRNTKNHSKTKLIAGTHGDKSHTRIRLKENLKVHTIPKLWNECELKTHTPSAHSDDNVLYLSTGRDNNLTTWDIYGWGFWVNRRKWCPGHFYPVKYDPYSLYFLITASDWLSSQTHWGWVVQVRAGLGAPGW